MSSDSRVAFIDASTKHFPLWQQHRHVLRRHIGLRILEASLLANLNSCIEVCDPPVAVLRSQEVLLFGIAMNVPTLMHVVKTLRGSDAVAQYHT